MKLYLIGPKANCSFFVAYLFIFGPIIEILFCKLDWDITMGLEGEGYFLKFINVWGIDGFKLFWFWVSNLCVYSLKLK